MVDADFFKKYQSCYNDPEDAEELIRHLWRISEFTDADLKKNLIEIADEEFDDDYQEFLKKDVLVKSALRMLGANGKLKEIEAALVSCSDHASRVAAVAPLIGGSGCEHIKNLRSDMLEKYDNNDDYFLCLIAESAILLVLSKKVLNEWSQSFKRVCDSHPEPFVAIANMLGMAMRGENIIGHARGYTHRGFDDAGSTFEELLKSDDFSVIWSQKRKRIENALSREL